MKNKKFTPFPQQPTADEFFSMNYIPNSPVGFYQRGGMTNGIAYPQQPTYEAFIGGYSWPRFQEGREVTPITVGNQPDIYGNMTQQDFQNIKSASGRPTYVGKHYKSQNPNESRAKSKWRNFKYGVKDFFTPDETNANPRELKEGVGIAFAKGGQPCYECGGSYEAGGQTGTGNYYFDEGGTDGWNFDEMEYKNGGWINKVSKGMEKKGTKGSFTKYCGGKVTDECIKRGLNSPDPTTRKRASLAKTFRKIKKEEGGQSGFGKDVSNYGASRKDQFMNSLRESYDNSKLDEQIENAMGMEEQYQYGGANSRLYSQGYNWDNFDNDYSQNYGENIADFAGNMLGGWADYKYNKENPTYKLEGYDLKPKAQNGLYHQLYSNHPFILPSRRDIRVQNRRQDRLMDRFLSSAGLPNYGYYPGYTWPMAPYQQQQQTNQQQQTVPADKKKEYQEYVDWYNENPPSEGYSRAAQQPYEEWYQENYPNQQATTTQTQQQRMTPFIPQNITETEVIPEYGNKWFNKKTPSRITYRFKMGPNSQDGNNPSGNMTASTSMYLPNLSKNNIPGTNQDLNSNNQEEDNNVNNPSSVNNQEQRSWRDRINPFKNKGKGVSDNYMNQVENINQNVNQRIPEAASKFVTNVLAPNLKYNFGGGLRRAQEGMQQPSEEEMMMMQQAQQQQPQQEGGQDMMQQIGQALQQGVQPEQIIVQLIQQQVSPEEIMQIFVELGMPQEQVEGLILAITEKMQGSQQQMDPRQMQQGVSEEQMMMQQDPRQMQQAAMMMYGGYHPSRRLRKAVNGNFGNDEANAPMYNPTSMEDEIGFAPSKRVDWINTPDRIPDKLPSYTLEAKTKRVNPWKGSFSGPRGAESILSGVKAITGAGQIADYGRQSEVAADKMLPDAWSPTQTAKNLGDIVGNTGVFRPNEKVGRRYQDNPFSQFYRRDGGQYATGKEYYMDGGEIDRLKELGYIVEYLD